MFDAIGMADLPAWWHYPKQCGHGHDWRPGQVTVGWTACDCPEARVGNLGHLWVRCRAAEGCTSIWYWLHIARRLPSAAPARPATSMGDIARYAIVMVGRGIDGR
jgi:hypothetical protein